MNVSFKYNMQRIYELPISFTFEQVRQFGELTGDNGPVHSVDGVVQGGFILSMLPQWLKNTNDGQEFIKGSKQAVSIMLDVKFRNKLIADQKAVVKFTYTPSTKFTKILWEIYDNEKEYCSGNWIIHKS
jgi:hypothetical protein